MQWGVSQGLSLQDEDQKRVQYRRRMRGTAVFFMIVSIIGALGILVGTAASNGEIGFALALGVVFLCGGLFAAALGAWHGSRLAAVALLAIVCITPPMSLISGETLSFLDWARSILYIGLASFMVISALRYHRASKRLEQSRGGIAVVRWLGSLTAWSFTAAMGFGALALAYGTSTAVLKGSEISEEQLVWLAEQNFLQSHERPLYLYLDGVFSMEEGGSFLTNEYAGGWWKENGEMNSVWIPLGQICEVKLVQDGSFVEDAIYSIHSPGDELWIQLWLSIENNMHKQFISRMKTINKRRMSPEVKNYCDENRKLDWVEIAALNGISKDIVPPDQVSSEQRQWLAEREFLLESETILKFYSYGAFHIEEGGALLTDQYFGGWFDSSGELTTSWFELGEICQVDPPRPANTDGFVFYKIWDIDADWMDMYLPAHDDQAANLIADVLALNDTQMSDATRETCTASTFEEVGDQASK